MNELNIDVALLDVAIPGCTCQELLSEAVTTRRNRRSF